MVRTLGEQILKSTTTSPVVQTVPVSRVYNASDVLQATFGGGSLTVKEKDESIMYTRSVKGQPLKYNRCIHHRYYSAYDMDATSYLLDFDLTAGHEGWYTQYYGGHAHSRTAHIAARAIIEAETGIPPDGHGIIGDIAGDLIDEAWQRARPDFTELSLPNFLFELGDVRKIFQVWNARKSVAKNVAGAHLNYAFGIKPTLGDISTALSSLIALGDRLAQIRQRVNRVETRRVTLNEEVINTSGQFNYQSASIHPVNWTLSVSRKTEAHFKFKYKAIPAMSQAEEKIRLFLDTLGFELNPRIIWEAIPFSFIVDWFLNVGNFLDSLKIDALEIPIELVDSCLQFREDKKYVTQLSLNVGSATNSPTVWGAWVESSEYFERLPIDPSDTAFRLLGFRNPRGNQWRLLVSLATVLRRD